ncbi:MAG: ribosomal protein S18-alanine N-acetyltransferase [Thermoleophilia bacterium]
MMFGEGAESLADSVVIRPMVANDLAAVVAIERRCYPLPWPESYFREVFTRPRSLCLVGVVQGRVVGYLMADLFIDVWHIMNVCVDESARRRGIGAELMRTCISLSDRCPNCGHTLEVRISNAVARDLYRSLGFVTTGVRPHYYTCDGEDALCMWRDPRACAS